jgi:hypothetical protein
VREHAREKSAGREMLRRRRAIIGNRSAQFKTAGELLRMLAFHAASGGKYGGLPVMRSNFSPAQNFRRAKIAFADFVASGQPL